jgi:regulator of RNase E activity RraA
MSETYNTPHHITSVADRYQRLYTGAIADMLDKNGYRDQVLPHYITPVTKADRVAGPAFTGQGRPCDDRTNSDMEMRLRMLSSIPPGTVSIWSCGESAACAHWGEIMSTAARQRGCGGAVLDGGVRDIDFVNAMNFPVFARFQCAASSVGRWEITGYQLTISIGKVEIHPGDFIFGDTDGVVVVPQAIVLNVLEEAEDVYRRESELREELRRGVTVKEAYEKYGSL